MSIATLRKAFMDTYFPPVPAMGIFHFERADMSRYPTFVSRGHAYAGIGPPKNASRGRAAHAATRGSAGPGRLRLALRGADGADWAFGAGRDAARGANKIYPP